jgi:hypothetical protein
MKVDKHLSYSQMKRFMSCPFEWHLYYQLGLRAIKLERPPTLGNFVHTGIKSAILGFDPYESISVLHEKTENKWIDKLESEAMDELLDVRTDAVHITKRALAWIDLDRWETVEYNGAPLVEANLMAPIPGWAGFTMYLDWCAKDKETGNCWIIDWKVRSKIHGEDEQAGDYEEINLQKAIYQCILLQHGIQTSGSKIGEIRAATPKEPKVNKDGSISRAACLTDWPTYKAAVIRHGGDPDAYLTVAAKLNDRKWENWVTTYRSPQELRNIWINIVMPWAERMALSQVYRFVSARHLGSFLCPRCWAKDFCLADLRGHDAASLIGRQYYITEQKSDYKEEDEIVIQTRPDNDGTETEDQHVGLRGPRNGEDGPIGVGDISSGDEERFIPQRRGGSVERGGHAKHDRGSDALDDPDRTGESSGGDILEVSKKGRGS